jgi:hypothetical protein
LLQAGQSIAMGAPHAWQNRLTAGLGSLHASHCIPVFSVDAAFPAPPTAAIFNHGWYRDYSSGGK